jgi:hypothetical protein
MDAGFADELGSTLMPGDGRRGGGGGSGGGEQRPALRRQARPAGAAAPSPAPPGGRSSSSSAAGDPAAELNPWSLTFRGNALEAAFATHYGHTMWRTDLASCLLHLCFYCTILFTPGPLGYLAWKLPWHTIARGVTYLYWVPVIAIPRLRAW